MKTIPLIFLAVACLAVGWFTHYTLVPETEVIIDTLTVYDTTYVVELRHTSDLEEANPVVIRSTVGWADITIADTATIGKVLWETTDGDTIESFQFKNDVILGRMMKVKEALSK